MSSAVLDIIVNALGWIGAIGCVGAYLLVTNGKWTPKGLPFQFTNLASASLLCLVAGYHGVWPSVAANIVWIAIGVHAIVAVARARYLSTRDRRISSASVLDAEVGLAA